MKITRLLVRYSIVSWTISLLTLLLLLLQTRFAFTGLAGAGFFLLLGSYLNCLPLAIVSIFLLLKKEGRRYGLINFAVIFLVLYFAVKVFGKSL